MIVKHYKIKDTEIIIHNEYLPNNEDAKRQQESKLRNIVIKITGDINARKLTGNR